jgi:3',5'-cyclic AMP phosphodiesterase CpdA
MSDKKVVVAQISDFHVGDHYFRPELLEETISEVNALKPDVVIVGGDLTTLGLRVEYETARAYIKTIECPRVVVVPGNHDSRNVGHIHFEHIFGSRFQVLRHKGVVFVCIDSSMLDNKDGRVGRDRYTWLREHFESPADFRILVMHHHLVSVPGTGRERNIVLDAGDVLKILFECNVDLVLSGHKHVPHLWQFGPMKLVNAGTVSSLRLRGAAEPCYNIIEIQNGKAAVYKKHVGEIKERMG